jgi:type II secretory pathway component PulC
MRTRKARFWLVSLGVVCCMIAALSLAWGMRRPVVATLEPQDIIPTIRNGNQQPVSSAAARIDENAEVWGRPYRRPLEDAPPVVSQPVVAPVKAPPLNLKLMGTILEPGRERAIFSTAKGVSVLRKVGETVGDTSAAEVVQIARDQVVVRYNGELVTLVLQKSK